MCGKMDAPDSKKRPDDPASREPAATKPTGQPAPPQPPDFDEYGIGEAAVSESLKPPGEAPTVRLPREGFADALKLAELQRQAEQRMREEERTPGNVPAVPHPTPVAPVYGAPPPLRESPMEKKPLQEYPYSSPALVYGGPPPRPSDTARVDTPRFTQTVYGGPPLPAKYETRPLPAPAYGGAPVFRSSRRWIVMGIILAALAAVTILIVLMHVRL